MLPLQDSSSGPSVCPVLPKFAVWHCPWPVPCWLGSRAGEVWTRPPLSVWDAYRCVCHLRSTSMYWCFQRLLSASEDQILGEQWAGCPSSLALMAGIMATNGIWPGCSHSWTPEHIFMLHNQAPKCSKTLKWASTGYHRRKISIPEFTCPVPVKLYVH